MVPFRILDLPSVAADEVLKMATPYDLFSLSMHSKKAQNIVKTFANRYKYHLDVNVNKSRIDFNYEKAEKNELVFEVLLGNKRRRRVLRFDGCTTKIYTKIYVDKSNEKNETVVETYWNGVDRWSGFKCLIEYMSSVFKNMTFSVNFGSELGRVNDGERIYMNSKERKQLEEDYPKIVRGIKEAIKKIKPRFICFEDMNSSYTYKPISELVVNCKRVTIGTAKLNNQECKKLVNKWMEGGALEYAKFSRGRTCFYRIRLQHVAPDFADTIESDCGDMYQKCEIERADGVRAKLRQDPTKFVLEVI